LLDMQPIVIEVAAASELENAIAEATRRRRQALIVPGDGVFLSNRVRIMRASLRNTLPTVVEIGTSWRPEHY
jgi:hypothetical protein